jgi:RNA polymerase sigma-70 factor (ECF subfamily)
MPTPALDGTESRAAFEREALPHLDSVYRFARSLTRDDTAAEDLAQDTFLQAWRAWHQYTPGTKCLAWLFTICRNLRARQAQRAQREEPTDSADLESLASAALHASLVETDPHGQFLEMPDLRDRLSQELLRLPEEYREVVILADVQDQSYATIAEILGVPVGTVKSRLFRGRRMLQEGLIEFARDAGIIAEARSGGPV